jgi:hypothetical protein
MPGQILDLFRKNRVTWVTNGLDVGYRGRETGRKRF